MVKLKSGTEVSDELLGNVIRSIVLSHAESGFEEFVEANGAVEYELQTGGFEDNELSMHFSIEDAAEIMDLVRPAVEVFCGRLAAEFRNIEVEIEGKKPWEKYKQE